MGIETMKRASAMFAAAVLALAGCSGEDGSPGAAGEDGTSCTVDTNETTGITTVTCTDGTVATVANGDDGADGVNGVSCTLATSADGTRTVTCPNGTVVLPAVELAGKVLVTDQAVATDGADVVVTFKVALNGAPSSAFTNKYRAYRHGAGSGASAGSFLRTSIDVATVALSVDANGVYTARLPGMATTVGTAPTTFMLSLNTGTAEPAATVVAHSAAGAPKSTVSDQACLNCHGDVVFREGHHDNNPQGVSACVVCHVRADSSESRLGTSTNLTTGVAGTAPGTRLMGYVHGIHNSHNMPAGSITQTLDPDGSSGPLPAGPYTVAKPEGVYARNGSLKLLDTDNDKIGDTAVISSPFSIGFPSYMNNCSTCHDTQENLDAVLAKPVSFQTCFSCHDNWGGFSNLPPSPIHTAFNASTNCGTCHGGGVASTSTVGDFHGKRQVYTARNGLLYDGKDQSIEQGKRIAMKIDSITRDDTDPLAKKLVVTWSATLDGNPVDPCNANVATAPVFIGAAAVAATGQSASNMSLLQAYAQGDDWVSAGVGTSPGQPISENLTTTNTVCASNVATSTIAAATTTATKGVLGLQGKPQVTFTSGTYTRVIQVRSPSPTREFVTATGAEPTGTRRPIVDSQKCLGCHQGSLYQHGGNRIDNVDLCVMCHNPASNEKNNRVAIGVDVSEAYDGKAGQTYDLRYMLHAIHSAGETNAPLVYYRGMGIYAFGSEASIAALPNWPGAGSQTVYGSSPATTRTHNEIVVHYPRALNDCGACHTSDAGTVTLPSTTTAVAVTTYDAGATPWGTQTDDVLMSPATASCMSCHQSGDVAMQGALRAHAYQNSWTPAVFTNGRADILGGGASESCLLCHGAGRVSDFNAAHGN
jgi:OmcA/MtrC family decaheme c-type cytochrome